VIVPVHVAGVSASQPVVTLERTAERRSRPARLLFVKPGIACAEVGSFSPRAGAAGVAEGRLVIQPDWAVVLKTEGLASLCRFMPPEVTVSTLSPAARQGNGVGQPRTPGGR
jgi:hypothetical protein